MAKTPETEIGYVIEVSGNRVIVELTVDTTVPLDGDYYPGQPGSHVKIPFRDLNIIGTVANIRMLDVTPSTRPGQEAAGKTISKKVAECLLIGTLHNGQFSRGVAIYPNVGQKVKMVGLDELKEIFSEFVSQGFSFACLAQAEDQRAFIHVDRFFGRHTAILGTTGCGKSCTVASILQHTIDKYPDTHIFVIDLHGEYANAFPDHTQLIEADKVELPYWLLNFEEFQDLAVDVTEFTAHNQITGLRDALLQARQNTDKEEKLGLGNAVTVDSPIYFDLQRMLKQIQDWNVEMVPSPSTGKPIKGPLNGIFDRFLIRFDSKTNDPRFRFMFSPTLYSGNASLLQLLKEYLSIDTGKRITVIDLSGIPFEAVSVVASVISRVVYEFNFWNPDRKQFPILMVFEEAHNYIPNRPEAKFSSAKFAVERLAKEGRKYGIGIMVVSQRPKELSETVISQCNTFIVMRLTNPDDQNYVRRLVPDSLAGLMDMVPSLRTGEALIVGDSVVMPTRVIVDFPDPQPDSADVKFAECWAKGIKDMDVSRIVKRWRARRKDL